MGLFGRKYPYVNFHELNLDWIIEEIAKLEEHTVLSVNGQTGEVVLYQDPNVVFPAIDSNNWTITRTAGTHEIGLQLQANQLFIRYDGSTNQVYTHDSPPPYPVTSVDGKTGAVITMPDAGTRLPDVTENYTNIRRQINTGTADQAIVGIQVEKDKAYRMQGNQRLQLYDSANQPPYPVTSVNGKTGVVTIAIPITELSVQDATWVAAHASPDNTAGLMRETAAGPVTLWLDGSLDPVSGDHIAAYISWTDPEDETNIITQKLLTNADIPSSAGVVSINGLTGVVTLSANNILYNTTDTVKDKFNDVDTILDNLAVDMAPAYRSDSTYSVGDRVTYQGRIYVCTTAITSPEAFNIDHWAVSQNMTYQINQINNRLITDERHINSLQKSLGIVLNGNTTSVAVAAGQYVIVETSTISGITDGLYTANAAWEAGAIVTAAYLTAVPNGGLNALNSNLATTFPTVTKTENIKTNSVVSAKRNVNVVSLYMDVYAVFDSSEYVTIANLSDAPSTNVYFTMIDSNDRTKMCRVTSDGLVQIHGTIANRNYMGCLTYIVNS